MTQTTAPPPTTTSILVDHVDVDEHDHIEFDDLEFDDVDDLELDEHQHIELNEHDSRYRFWRISIPFAPALGSTFCRIDVERQPGDHGSEIRGRRSAVAFPDASRFGNGTQEGGGSGHRFDSGDGSTELSRCDDTGTRCVQDWMFVLTIAVDSPKTKVTESNESEQHGRQVSCPA